MTKKQMEELVDMIVNKLSEKQKELDKEFIKDLEASNVPVEVHQRPEQKDRIILEITRMIILLDALEKSEEYEKAAEVSKRIADLRKLLINL
jgi:hypothetical protein